MSERKSMLHAWEWIVLVVVAASAIAALFFMRQKPRENLEARIYHGGELVETVDLGSTADGEVDLPGEEKVHFEVKDHQIRFYQVNCPDKVCEQTGFLSREGDIAICMPNQYHMKIYAKSS